MADNLDEQLMQQAMKAELESLNQKQRKNKVILETTTRVTKEVWIKQQGDTSKQPTQQRSEEKGNDREDDDDQKKDKDDEDKDDEDKDDEDKDDEDKDDEDKESEEERQQDPQNQGVDQAKNLAKDEAKEVAKKAAWEAILATSPYWGTALLIIAGIVLLFIVVIAVPVAVCNSSYLSSAGPAKAIFTASGICKNLSFDPSQTIIVDPNAPRPPGGGLTDAEARKLLAEANICNYPLGFGRIDCVNASEPQTSLKGIQQVTLNEIIRFKADCDIWTRGNGGGVCSVVVSGGTETTGGHEGGPCSHLSGNKIDIRPITEINNYILAKNVQGQYINFTSAGTRSGDPQYQNNATKVIYTRESNHWDIGGVGCA